YIRLRRWKLTDFVTTKDYASKKELDRFGVMGYPEPSSCLETLGLYASIKVHCLLVPFRQLPRKQPSKVTVPVFRIGLDGHTEIGRRAALEGERRPRMP